MATRLGVAALPRLAWRRPCPERGDGAGAGAAGDTWRWRGSHGNGGCDLQQHRAICEELGDRARTACHRTRSARNLWRSCSNEGQSVYLYAYISHTLTHMYTRISTYILSICLSVYLLSIYVLAFFGGCVASEGRESVCERVSGREREREREMLGNGKDESG